MNKTRALPTEKRKAFLKKLYDSLSINNEELVCCFLTNSGTGHVTTVMINYERYAIFAKLFKKKGNSLEYVPNVDEALMAGTNKLRLKIYISFHGEDYELASFNVTNIQFAPESADCFKVTVSLNATNSDKPKTPKDTDTLPEKILQSVYSNRGSFSSQKICISPEESGHFRGLFFNQQDETKFSHVFRVFVDNKTPFCIYALFYTKKGKKFLPIESMKELLEIGAEKVYFKLYAYQDYCPSHHFELATFKVSGMRYFHPIRRFLLFADIPTEELTI